ncbi:hypothetical protein F5Y10DRAFT_287729 [Nemania abortiva]|nr:hypothetical protein F5Y10DRAFT_287729 [Nemania abortiva]
MYSPALILSALLPALSAATPHTPLPNMTEAQIHTPGFLLHHPLLPHNAILSADLRVKCTGIGPECMWIPGTPPTPGLSVRVYCAAVRAPPLKLIPGERPPHNKNKNRFVVRPSVMNPCPAGTQCSLGIAGPELASSRLRPLPYPRSAVSDAWRFFENEDGEIPGLKTEDLTGWVKLDGLIRQEEGDDVRDYGTYAIPQPLTEIAPQVDEAEKSKEPTKPWYAFACSMPGDGKGQGAEQVRAWY